MMPTPYDYNLILALPTGSLSERLTITGHRSKVFRGVAKHQRFEDSSDEFGGPVSLGDMVLVEGGEVEELHIWPGLLRQGIKDKWLRCFERLQMANRSRLVLFAHGDPTTTRVADRTGRRMATLLVDRFGLRKVTRISVLACCAGGDSTDAFPGAWYLQIPSVKCFAQEFHEFLGRQKGVYTQVTARTGIVKSKDDGRRVVWFPNEPGAGPTSGNGEWKHKAPGTKLLWYWEMGQQRVKEVY
jgi:hypothetical protein